MYDLFYLCGQVNQVVLKEYLHFYIFDDKEMIEMNALDVEARLASVFSNKLFLKRMANPDYAWLDEPVEHIVNAILKFVHGL